MNDRLDWHSDGRDWPHHEASRFIEAGGLRWHVQQLGPANAPALLLLHGTGASTHSWRDLMPLLAAQASTPARVIALDLPGHGFTTMPATREALSLPRMAEGVAALMKAIGAAPRWIVGHSAGAAIGARLCLDGHADPSALVSLNGALLPLSGWAGSLFSPAARLLALNPWVPRLFSWRAADPSVIARLLEGTGSTLDATGIALYRRLVNSPGHTAAALGMMAQWDLRPLQRDLPRLRTALHLLVGERDRTLPPDQAWAVAERVPGATVTRLPGLGHLAHEERPDLIADKVLNILVVNQS